ncbi:hypothetical protein [Oricola sp.]|uniref:hypothetical protein n=1 Tax=Oricola sp. TaxID=1979950 RepID=UPI003514AB14
MVEFLLWGVFALEVAQDNRLSGVPILEIARTPIFINLGILGALIVPLVSQGNVRNALTAVSLVCLMAMCGLIFAAGVMTFCGLVFLFARLLQAWSARRGEYKLPLLVAWLTVNAVYLPFYFLKLPQFGSFMSVGELALLWGPAFLVFKALHFIHQALKGRVDFAAPGMFRRYLLYMVHFASFYMGPFQKFAQFDQEVSTCKARVSWANAGRGALRILIGAAKMIFVFHVFNIQYFYKSGYYGPFVDALFANAPEAEPGHLWLMVYLFMFRLLLFVSAYSDGVIGMNLMMGIRVPENSRWPFFARDMPEFWRRWHIQAGAFLRDEVFIPVGGLKRKYLGFFAVFAYSGFWHFPLPSTWLAFPALHLAIFYATIRWYAFCDSQEQAGTNAWRMIGRLGLRDTVFSATLGMVFVFHANMLSVLFIHDHFYGGTRILPRMFGLT